MPKINGHIAEAQVNSLVQTLIHSQKAWKGGV